jgi:DNA-binding MarR family transcriptional regulator
MLGEARKKGARLLARFGSELNDHRMLALAVLAQAGPLDLDGIASQLGIAVAMAGPLVDQLVQACLVTLAGNSYDIDVEQFEILVANLEDADPERRRS